MPWVIGEKVGKLGKGRGRWENASARCRPGGTAAMSADLESLISRYAR